MNGSGDMKGLKADFSVILGMTLTKQQQKHQVSLKSILPDIRMPYLTQFAKHWCVTHADRRQFDNLD